MSVLLLVVYVCTIGVLGLLCCVFHSRIVHPYLRRNNEPLVTCSPTPSASTLPSCFQLDMVHGFIEELVVNDDPEYQVRMYVRTHISRSCVVTDLITSIINKYWTILCEVVDASKSCSCILRICALLL